MSHESLSLVCKLTAELYVYLIVSILCGIDSCCVSPQAILSDGEGIDVIVPMLTTSLPACGLPIQPRNLLLIVLNKLATSACNVLFCTEANLVQ